MSLSNNYLSSLGNLGTRKCCDLKGLGPIGPVGPHGPIGPIGPDGTEGITGFIGPQGKLTTGGYSSYANESFSMDDDVNKYISFTTLLNGNFESNKHYLYNMSFYLTSPNLDLTIINSFRFNITFYVTVEYASHGLVNYYPSTFFTSDEPPSTFPTGMLLTQTNSGSTYSYSATLNDWVYIDPGELTDINILNMYITIRINYSTRPTSSTFEFKWTSAVTPVN
jgi:hypothetical protein